MKHIAPNRIDMLDENGVFVFGSNLEGKHISGAAKAAREKFGAVWGCGDGFQGQSYAIPTMQGGVETIVPYVKRFIIFAKANPQLKFLVTRIGCGIAGFKDEEIAPLFVDALHIDNIYLPESFWQAIEDRLPQPYTRFMRMIAELHKRGHELLRLCPTLSPSGCYWRSALTTKKNTWIYCGALLGSYEPGEGLVILSHGEMPWFDRIQVATPEEDADMFVREFPILAEATKGSDYLYVRWFQKVLEECEHGHIVYALAEGDFCVRNGFMIGAREPLCFPPMGDSEEQCQY